MIYLALFGCTAVIIWQVHAAVAYLNRELQDEEQRYGPYVIFDQGKHQNERPDADERKAQEDFHSYH